MTPDRSTSGLDVIFIGAGFAGLYAVHRFRARLTRDPGDFPSMATVADELHADVRTLRRRLATEGTSFREIVDDMRETLAVELLSVVDLTVEETARRLGYTEVSSFTHAFTRWRGIPPRTFRARAQASR